MYATVDTQMVALSHRRLRLFLARNGELFSTDQGGQRRGARLYWWHRNRRSVWGVVAEAGTGPLVARTSAATLPAYPCALLEHTQSRYRGFPEASPGRKRMTSVKSATASAPAPAS